eukprot:3047012-Amphidinium_carterae.1
MLSWDSIVRLWLSAETNILDPNLNIPGKEAGVSMPSLCLKTEPDKVHYGVGDSTLQAVPRKRPPFPTPYVMRCSSVHTSCPPTLSTSRRATTEPTENNP